jgi:hypothetical protein
MEKKMKRKNVIMTLLVVMGLLMIPQWGKAEMVPLSEEQMSVVAGQAGVSFEIERLNLNTTIDTVSYGDGDGLGPGTSAGYLSLCGIMLKGAAKFTDPLMVDVTTTENGNGNGKGRVGLTSMNMTMTGMRLQVERFSIDAVRIGSAPGTGNSLGSIGISNMTANVTGNVHVSTR